MVFPLSSRQDPRYKRCISEIGHTRFLPNRANLSILGLGKVRQPHPLIRQSFIFEKKPYADFLPFKYEDTMDEKKWQDNEQSTPHRGVTDNASWNQANGLDLPL